MTGPDGLPIAGEAVGAVDATGALLHDCAGEPPLPKEVYTSSGASLGHGAVWTVTCNADYVPIDVHSNATLWGTIGL